MKKTISITLEVGIEERDGASEPSFADIMRTFVFDGTRRAPGGCLVEAQIVEADWAE